MNKLTTELTTREKERQTVGVCMCVCVYAFNVPYLLKPLESIKHKSEALHHFQEFIPFTVVYLFYSCLHLLFRLLPSNRCLYCAYPPSVSCLYRFADFWGRENSSENRNTEKCTQPKLLQNKESYENNVYNRIWWRFILDKIGECKFSTSHYTSLVKCPGTFPNDFLRQYTN